MTLRTFESHSYIRNGLCLRCNGSINEPCVVEVTVAASSEAPFAHRQQSSDASWTEQTSLYEECIATQGPLTADHLRQIVQERDEANAARDRALRRSTHAVQNWTSATKERDTAQASLDRPYAAYRTDTENLRREIAALRNASAETVSLKAEVQRLHDILGRAGISFDAGTAQPVDPIPARALRPQAQQIGLRTP